MSLEDCAVYSTKEIGVMLGVSPQTVAWWLRTGKMKGYYHRGNRNRKVWKVLEKDIQVFLYGTFLEEPIRNK